MQDRAQALSRLNTQPHRPVGAKYYNMMIGREPYRIDETPPSSTGLLFS